MESMNKDDKSLHFFLDFPSDKAKKLDKYSKDFNMKKEDLLNEMIETLMVEDFELVMQHTFDRLELKNKELEDKDVI